MNFGGVFNPQALELVSRFYRAFREVRRRPGHPTSFLTHHKFGPGQVAVPIPSASLQLIARQAGFKGSFKSAPIVTGDSSKREVGILNNHPVFLSSRSVGISTRLSSMPHTRRGISFSFRKRGRKRKRVGSSIAKLALKKVRKLERKLEVKTVEFPITTLANIANTGVISNFTLIAQGDDSGLRDGLKITPFELKINFQWLGDAASVDDIYRTIIFRDMRQVDSVVPTVPNVLAENHPLARFTLVNRTRWNILYDETFTSSNDAAVRLCFVRLLRIKLKGQMIYTGAANTTISKNGLYMLNVASVNSLPNFVFNARLKYNDL